MNNKIIIFNIVLFLAVGITAYSIANNNVDFKTNVFNGIKISVPSGSEFFKVDTHYYKDTTRYLEVNIGINYNQL